MQLSIIIPTFNEEENIISLLNQLQLDDKRILEVILVDGGSTDKTVELATAFGIQCILSPKKGRAVQMNFGATQAKGDIFYFIHADTLPPSDYIDAIEKALQRDFPVGCFRYKFRSNKKLLKINAFFTRFSMLWCRGGDQSLYIDKTLFEEMNGFREDYKIMEDFDFIIRVKKKAPFKIIQKDMSVSARKYKDNGYLRVQIANLVVFNMFRFGYSQDAMVKTYKKLLKDIKN